MVDARLPDASRVKPSFPRWLSRPLHVHPALRRRAVAVETLVNQKHFRQMMQILAAAVKAKISV